jgi:hypothetical protein
MTVLDAVQDAQTQGQTKQQATASASKLSAVVEAAYILEALRK